MSSWWTDVNPILADGELGLERDTFQFKVGNGVTPWVELTYYLKGPAGPMGPQGNGSLYNRELTGVMDGVNMVFTTESLFLPRSTRLHKDNQRLTLGRDYIETGENQVTLLCKLRPTTVLQIDYDPQSTITT